MRRFYHLAELDGCERIKAINHMECILGRIDFARAEESFRKMRSAMTYYRSEWVKWDYIEQSCYRIGDEFSDDFLRYADTMIEEDEEGWILAKDVCDAYARSLDQYLDTITYEEDEIIRQAEGMGILFDDEGDPQGYDPFDRY